MSSRSNIALLRTGLLGRAIAERLHTVGHRVVVYNRTAAKALPLKDYGMTVVDAADIAVTQAEYVLLVLADAPAIRSVLFSHACAAALKGRTIVQMGTIGSQDSLAIKREVEGHGGAYCEAPVLGSLAEARAGTLFVMAGGTEEQFVRLNPVLCALGPEPRLIGPVGKASALKLALNHLIAAETAAFALSLAFIQQSGVSVETFMSLVRESALYARTFDKKLPRLLKRDYHHPNFSTRHLLKDVGLFVQEAADRGLATSSLEGLPSLLESAIARGFGDLDYSAMYEALNPADGEPHS
jgi:3-hydroxyisobutyrate dehydrogenase